MLFLVGVVTMPIKEKIIIKALLTDSSTWKTIFTTLEESDFTDMFCRKIFEYCKKKHENGINFVDADVLCTELNIKPKEIIDIFEQPSIYTITDCIKGMKEHSTKNRIKDALINLLNKDVKEIALELKNIENMITGSVGTLKKASDAEKMVDEIKKHSYSFFTTLPSFNEKFAGFFPGELTIIAGKTSTGKTAFALHLAYDFALESKKVLYVSREMAGEAIFLRLASKLTSISLWKIRKGETTEEEDKKIKEALQKLNSLNILIDEHAASIADIYMVAKLEKPDIVFIDYLQLLSDKGRSRYEEVGKIVRGLKSIAVDVGIPVVALSQFSRGEKKPTLEKLRDSGEIEEHSNNVIALYCTEETRDEPVREIEVSILKQRDGITGSFILHFIPDIQSFVDPKNAITDDVIEDFTFPV